MPSADLRLRPATAADLSAVRSCARAAYKKYIARMPVEPAPMHADFALQIERGQVQVALYQEQFAGYAVFYGEGDHLQLENVAVLPALSGQGIGGGVIGLIEQQARQRGFAAVELYTNIAMTENLQIYPHLGYVEIARRLEDGFERVYFRKSL